MHCMYGMRWLYGLIGYCLMMAVATAAPPTITAPPNIYGPPGEWVEIRVETSGKWVRYRPLDSGLKVFPNDKLKDSNSTWVTGEAGKRYRLLVYTGNDDGGAEVEVTVVFGGDIIINDKDKDKKEEEKKKEPVVTTIDDFWVIMVEETSQRTIATAKVLGDFPFWKSLPGSGVAFYDKDSEEAKKYKYDALAKQTGFPLPVLMLVDNRTATAGKLIKAIPLPVYGKDGMGVEHDAQKEIRDFIKTNTGK